VIKVSKLEFNNCLVYTKSAKQISLLILFTHSHTRRPALPSMTEPPPPPPPPLPSTESLIRRYKPVWRFFLIFNLALGGQQLSFLSLLCPCVGFGHWKCGSLVVKTLGFWSHCRILSNGLSLVNIIRRFVVVIWVLGGFHFGL
jgi:hypothetical protein